MAKNETWKLKGITVASLPHLLNLLFPAHPWCRACQRGPRSRLSFRGEGLPNRKLRLCHPSHSKGSFVCLFTFPPYPPWCSLCPPPPYCKSSPASSGPKPPPIPQPLHSPPLPFPPLPFPNHSVYPDSALPPTTVTIDPDKPMSVGSSKKEVCRQVFQQIELFLQPRSAQTFEELR